MKFFDIITKKITFFFLCFALLTSSSHSTTTDRIDMTDLLKQSRNRREQANQQSQKRGLLFQQYSSRQPNNKPGAYICTLQMLKQRDKQVLIKQLGEIDKRLKKNNETLNKLRQSNKETNENLGKREERLEKLSQSNHEMNETLEKLSQSNHEMNQTLDKLSQNSHEVLKHNCEFFKNLETIEESSENMQANLANETMNKDLAKPFFCEFMKGAGCAVVLICIGFKIGIKIGECYFLPKNRS